jgi:hypothetical protein
MKYRISVRMKPLMTVPEIESNGFFTYTSSVLGAIGGCCAGWRGVLLTLF